MRFAVSVLSPLAGFLLLTSLVAVVAVDSPKADVSQDPRREWFGLAQGRTEFEVSDPALVPSRLALAAEHSSCRYKEGIRRVPVRFIKLKSRRLAILLCEGPGASHMVFDLSNLQKPRPLEFPVLAQPEGFGTTASPGGITWNKDAGIFQTQTSNDMLPTIRLRYTYRFNDTVENDSPFVVVRVEAQWIPGPDEWTSIWGAEPWSFPAQPK
jgi:hypothetical protein